MRETIKLLLPFICLVACSNHQPVLNVIADTTASRAIANKIQDTFKRGSIITHITSLADATQSYALYIPVIKNNIAMPVVYFFDPHADGALPLQHYKTLADVFHFILVGSNNSKNGNDWNMTQNILAVLFNDTKNRLLIDRNRIYTCGFSGGAKVAGYAALHQSNIKEVIAAGAGLPEEEPIGNFPFHFTGIAGNGDMNMTDLVALNNELDKTATQHRLILFDGKHAWPPADAMHTAFAGLQLDAIRDKLITSDDSLVNAYLTGTKQQIKSDETSHQLVAAEEKCVLAANMLNGLSANTDWFVKEDNDIKNNPAYTQQQQEAQQLFATEQSMKQTYQQQLGREDISYWTITINHLQQKAKARTPEGAMYQRLLAYLSLTFYSISNRLIASNQNEPAQYFVALYKMADATNSEAWYFSALLNARDNNAKTTQDDLIKAAGYGFTDSVRMMQQSEFKTLSPAINFGLIESKMKMAER